MPGTRRSAQGEGGGAPAARRQRVKQRVYYSFHVPKGGVGKTRTVHAEAYALAYRGLNVLVVDCDHQRDLTHCFFGNEIAESYQHNYDDFRSGSGPAPRTLYESVLPLLRPGNQPTPPPNPLQKLARDPNGEHGSIHVILGDKNTSNLNVKIGMAWNVAANDPTKLEIPGAPFAMIARAAESVDADVILLDLHPDLGPLNCMLIMSCDYRLQPVEADSPSLEAMWNAEERIMRGHGLSPEDKPWTEIYQEWVTLTHDAINGSGKFSSGALDLRGHHVRNVKCKFMGIIMNKFTTERRDDGFAQGVCKDLPASAVVTWMRQQFKDVYKIASEYGEYAVGQRNYDKRLSGHAQRNYLLRVVGRVPNFAKLNGVSHEQRMPPSYVHSPADKRSILRVRRIYDQIAYNMLHITYLDNPDLLNHVKPKDLTEEGRGGPPIPGLHFHDPDEMDKLQRDLGPHWPA